MATVDGPVAGIMMQEERGEAAIIEAMLEGFARGAAFRQVVAAAAAAVYRCAAEKVKGMSAGTG